jgi:hypothetical protein
MKKTKKNTCNQTSFCGKGESLALKKAREALRRHQAGVWKARKKIQKLAAEESK